jgi:hypothetical protein
MEVSKLLSIVGRIRPEALDAIIPHSPAVGRWTSGFDRVALNPQPLPPREGFELGAVDLAHEIVRIAVAEEARGGSAVSLVSEIIDDWCGTPWPKKFPWPWPGPRRGEGPHPEPWDVATARVIGAVIFASVADRLADDKLAQTFSEGAERLAEAAVQR